MLIFRKIDGEHVEGLKVVPYAVSRLPTVPAIVAGGLELAPTFYPVGNMKTTNPATMAAIEPQVT